MQGIGGKLAVNTEHRVDRGMHHKIGHRSGKCCDLFFRVCHAGGNPHRKQNRQVRENDISRVFHDA